MSDLYLKNISLNEIIPDPDQPRNLFASLDELTEKAKSGDHRAKTILEKLKELATSILEVGLQQPISVYPAEHQGYYVILDGHRRWLATTLLYRQGQGDGTIACYVHPAPHTEEDILLSQLNANTQHEELNVFELARSSKKLKEYLKTNGGTVRLIREDDGIETMILSPGEADDKIWGIIEKKMGISRSRRYQIQAVLKLPPRIQQIAEEKALPESRLRYLIPLKDERIQEAILLEIVEKNLSNAEIKQRIKDLQEKFAETPAPAMPKPMRIRSALRPIGKLSVELKSVKNIPGEISDKDPRTVKSYRSLIPELKEAIDNLEAILAKIDFLEKE